MSYGLTDEQGGEAGELSTVTVNTKNPANRTDLLVEVLHVDNGVVIDTLDNEIYLTRLGGDAIAYFGVLIDDERYTVEIHGETKDLKDDVIAGRQNPLVTSPTTVKDRKTIKDFSYFDFRSPKLIWKLTGNNGKELETNNQFWEQFRRRIRAGHPLSLNHIH